MRLDLGSTVRCTDGEYGELDDLVIDPIERRLTHLVVAPHGRRDLARLVPVDRAHGSGPSDAEIRLDYTIAEVGELETVQKSAYLRLGDVPVEDPDWEVGIENTLALPYYRSFAPGGLGMETAPIGMDEHITELYDRVPKDTIEIRRASAVISSDNHRLGHVDGFVVDDGQRITHIVLEHGHFWGKRDVTIPVNSVAGIDTDEVKLNLSKDQVGKLDSVPVHRWSS